MRLANIYVGYLKVNRALEIAGIVIRQGFDELIARTWLGRRIRKRRIRQDKPVYTTEERLRLTIEDLGPTYIKFGQILADRPDVVSERFRSELKKLQSRALPFDDQLAVNLVEDELGVPIGKVFATFDRTCMASASIGQVYSATLLDGSPVVVKIRRPKIEQKIKLDLYLMRFLAAKLAKSYPEMAAINIVGVVDEFGESILRELDYNNEAANILRFQQMFANEPTVYIPKVYLNYTTRRLLVMERITGITPDDPTVLKANGLDTQQIALNGANALLTMVLRHGFFHADPHAGNIFIMPDNKIAFIDFGMVGVLTPKDMNFLANISMGFVRRDPAMIADSLITLCNVRFFKKRDELIFNLQQMTAQYSHVPIDKLDYAAMVQQCINLIAKYSLQIPNGIFMLVKSLATIQKVAEKLDPDIPFTPLITPYAKEVIMNRFAPRKLAGELYQALKNYANLAVNLPNDISEILYKLKQGEIRHNIRFENSEMLQKAVRNVGFRMAYAIILVGLFIGSVLLINTRSDLAYAKFLLWASSILIFVLIFKWMFRRK
ncbi:AarF/UbiB family protein [uncultured Rikenella sp.]|uniref:ABC1 kinase family protein n=1 Tax=uncultured Rikenella sp. TaxID=368003 RepID=UPI00260FEB1D|nr:AarF/UbiB family protein [uncultured Rikenella sp.]